MNGAVARKAFVPLLAATVSLPACALQMSGGKGRVLDTATQQPIEGASVEMECNRQLYYKSIKVRDVTVVSNKAGEYEFSLLDVAGCDFAYVRASKAGYERSDSIHTGYGYTSYGQVPKLRYLTAQADVVMLRLSAITPSRTGTIFREDGSPAHASEYRLQDRQARLRGGSPAVL